MKKKVRRGFALLLAVTVMVSLVACQEKEKKPAESSANQSAAHSPRWRLE